MNWFNKIIVRAAGPVPARVFLKILEKAYGVISERIKKGYMLTNPHNGRQATIHFHSEGEDIVVNTMTTSLKGLGIDPTKFLDRFNQSKKARYKSIPYEELGQHMELPTQEETQESIPEWQKTEWFRKQKDQYIPKHI